MISFIIAAIVCLVCAFFCAYWAIDRAERGTRAPDEFIVKQLTAGAWFFGVLCITFLAAAGFIEAMSPPSEVSNVRE